MTEVRMRRLRPDDDRSRFHSGDPDLDRYFQRFAGQNQLRHHLGVTYVAEAASELLGFVTVTPSAIEIDALPPQVAKRLPRYPLPVLRVARLAVATRARGQGIGHALLRFALSLAQRTATDIGCVGVVVDAKPGAEAFYRRFGFEALGRHQRGGSRWRGGWAPRSARRRRRCAGRSRWTDWGPTWLASLGRSLTEGGRSCAGMAAA